MKFELNQFCIILIWYFDFLKKFFSKSSERNELIKLNYIIILDILNYKKFYLFDIYPYPYH